MISQNAFVIGECFVFHFISDMLFYTVPQSLGCAFYKARHILQVNSPLMIHSELSFNKLDKIIVV